MRSTPGDGTELGERLGQRPGAPELGVAVGADDEQAASVGAAERRDAAAGASGVAAACRSSRTRSTGAARSRPATSRASHRTGGIARPRDRTAAAPGARERSSRDRDAAGRDRQRADRAARGCELGVAAVDEVLQRFDERLVREAQVLVAPTEQHGRAVRVRALRELGGEARLADARLAGNEREPSLSGLGRRPVLEQARELGLTTGERELAIRPQRGRQCGPRFDGLLGRAVTRRPRRSSPAPAGP